MYLYNKTRHLNAIYMSPIMFVTCDHTWGFSDFPNYNCKVTSVVQKHNFLQRFNYTGNFILVEGYKHIFRHHMQGCRDGEGAGAIGLLILGPA